MLGMSYDVLARKSGVSKPTVFRILSGRSSYTASFANVLSLARALGLELEFEEEASIENLQERQARTKAENLVRMVQGTSGLEGQAVSPKEYGRLVRQATRKLLTGSKRKLWGD